MCKGLQELCSLLLLSLSVAVAYSLMAKVQVAAGSAQNTNPNYAAIHEYGRIEWHRDSATLIAGGSRPLDMAAYTLSICLGIHVSAEDPHYEFKGDVLDVTAPEWSALHPDRHVYAGRPGKVEVSFAVERGEPKDIATLLNDAAREVNTQLPWAYKVTTRTVANQKFSSFVPTRYRNQAGELKDEHSYLDTKIDIPQQTASIADFAQTLTLQMSEALGTTFSCCQAIVIGQPWGSKSIHYEAVGTPAREVLEDLLAQNDNYESYNLRCQPLQKQYCFINVHTTLKRGGASSGVCTALGYD